MKIAYVTTYDPNEISCWSGLGYFIWKSLAQTGIEVELIGPLSLPPGIKKILEIKSRFHQKLIRGRYLAEHDVMAAKAYAQQAWRKLEGLQRIEAIVSPGTIPVAFLPGTIPVVTYSDTTHRLLFDSYPAYKELGAATRRDGDRIEQAAMRRASASVFASEWAAAGAVRDYRADPAKVRVVPFGANFERQPFREDVVRAIESRGFDEIRLLFVGIEWERKGGPVALEVVRALVKQGVPAQLTVVGCEPPIPAGDMGYVSVRGFIRKTPGGQKEISDEFAKSHFLILPSEAECYGLVYCEASALGVPSIARNVGGVGTIIKNGINGYLFDLQATAKDMADRIASLVREPANYRRLALSSVAEYEARLNWTVAAKSLEKVLKSVITNAGEVNLRQAVE
jgi:glycosyltransferase involved in cell wall biosynthesis